MKDIHQGKYPGNCPGKDAARHFVYQLLAKSHDPGKFQKYFHIHIMSYEGGDHKYLNKFKVKQLTCDQDEEARRLARKRRVRMAPEPICQSIVATVEWALKKKLPIYTINVDFCNTLANFEKQQDIQTILNLVDLNEVWVFLTFKRGREPGWSIKDRWEKLGIQRGDYKIYPANIFEYQNGPGSPMGVAIWGPASIGYERDYNSKTWHTSRMSYDEQLSIKPGPYNKKGKTEYEQ